MTSNRIRQSIGIRSGKRALNHAISGAKNIRQTKTDHAGNKPADGDSYP